jgi:stearoyl-CoA desaturase (Delta-9 desaturase)
VGDALGEGHAAAPAGVDPPRGGVTERMSRQEKIANLAGVVVPVAGVLAAIGLLWNQWVAWVDIALLAALYLVTALGVTVGFHRLLTHRAFATHPGVERLFARLGQLSVQGSVLDWVADHRKHHAHTDVEGDPHSPHVGHGSGLRGLWHAHTGWLLETQGQADWKRYARDLYENPEMRRIGRQFPRYVAISLLIPTVAGFVLHGMTLEGAARGYVWGGLVRIFLVHHVTWSVNSVCHVFGSRRFATEDRSTNVGWLALASLGESWHHNHHAFPRSAQHGFRRRELDPSAWVIAGMEKLGLAWDVVRIPPERQAAKLQRATRPDARTLSGPV